MILNRQVYLEFVRDEAEALIDRAAEGRDLREMARLLMMKHDAEQELLAIAKADRVAYLLDNTEGPNPGVAL